MRSLVPVQLVKKEQFGAFALRSHFLAGVSLTATL
jgi:hypothetical protein